MATRAKAPPGRAVTVIGSDSNRIRELFAGIAPDFQRLLPKEISAERLLQIALNTVRLSPDLAECTQWSFLGALLECGKLGLYPGVRGQAYLIPRRTRGVSAATREKVMEAHFQIGYQGLLELARRSEQIEKTEARVVYEGDRFAYELGTDPFISHQPQRNMAAEPILTAAYAIAWIKGARAPQFEVVEAWKMAKYRSFAQTTKIWDGPFADSMWKKTALRQLCKYLPASEELHRALALDELTEAEQSQGLGAEAQITFAGATDDGLSIDDILPPAAQPQPAEAAEGGA